MSLSTYTTATVTQYVNPLIRRAGRTPLLIILLWVIVLWWGERTVFRQSATACEWQIWESWPAHANPHHVLFVADPQLVDPHTYPGRPWPLSTLTVLYTDLYMRRMYSYLLQHTQPHTTIFLGDLFDGGREWAAAEYESPEARYQKYDTNFWLREYNRFMKIFVGTWYANHWNGYLTGEGRKIVASLPGNHDLGFAGGINHEVRNRFEAHFGPSNRIDIFGNHTFVSLDTVSLSAMDQVDPLTGSSGEGDGTALDTKHMDIWKPVELFLTHAKDRRTRAVQRRYQYLKSLTDPTSTHSDNTVLHMPKVKSPQKYGGPRITARPNTAAVSSSNFPTILLTHVPLYRNQDVTCGPLREKGNAIPLSAGYQYQNVLTPAISKDIVDHLDADQITMVYSGDDHDYCEISHGEFTGQIKEITVKSISWAMGVRKPGVQLASLWNPIDIDAISRGDAPTSTPRDTVQNHLCLLPDQLSIFIHYGQVLGLTFLILLVRAATYNVQRAQQTLPSPGIEKDNSQPLLPITRKRTPPASPQLNATNNTATPSRSHSARARSNGRLSGYGQIPSSSRSASPNTSKLDTASDTDDWGMPPSSKNSVFSTALQHGKGNLTRLEKLVHFLVTPAGSKFGEFVRSLNIVAGPVMLFYFWLLWNG